MRIGSAMGTGPAMGIGSAMGIPVRLRKGQLHLEFLGIQFRSQMLQDG